MPCTTPERLPSRPVGSVLCLTLLHSVRSGCQIETLLEYLAGRFPVQQGDVVLTGWCGKCTSCCLAMMHRLIAIVIARIHVATQWNGTSAGLLAD